MRKLIQAYKVFALVEILLLTYILFYLGVYTFKGTSDYIAIGVTIILFIVPIIIGLKIISFTAKNVRVPDTLLYTGHIFNFIKLIPFLLLIIGQTYFFSLAINRLSPFNEIGVIFYLLFFATFLFIIVSIITFITYFGISKRNRMYCDDIVRSIDSIGN